MRRWSRTAPSSSARSGRDGIVAYANRAVTTLLGWRPEEMVGRHVVEFVHPDELERVALAVDQQGEHGAPRGTTSFRLATADGGWAPVDLTASDVTDGEDRYLAVYCRPPTTSTPSTR